MKQKLEILPYSMLLLCALGWASSTIIIKATIGSIPAFHLMAGRFLFASLLLIAFKPKIIKSFTLKAIIPSSILAILLFLAYLTSIISLYYTSASKSGFLVALAVLFVPITQSLINRKHPSKWLAMTVGLSLIGMWMISGMNGDGFNLGDFYAILSSVTYTAYILAMSKLTHDHPTYTLTVLQLIIVTILSFITLFFFEDFNSSIFITSAVPILSVGLIGTALTTLTQTFAQQKVSAEAVGIILLGEPLFTLLMAITLLSEPTTLQGLMGAALLLSAMALTILKKL